MTPKEIPLKIAHSVGEVIQKGHPWVYQDAILSKQVLPAGSVVRLVNEQNMFVGKGIYDADSPIRVRVYTLDEAEPLDSTFRRKRLRQAYTARRALLADGLTNAFRLCNGEGDLLPGLIVDVYNNVLVVQMDGAGPASYWLPCIVDDLRAVLPSLNIETIYRKDRFASGMLWHQQTLGHETEITEHGVRFMVNIAQGQKTGFFLDQRENRLLIKQHAAGKTVWNGFSYSGGFSVYAALGGATSTTSVDLSAQALDTAQQNFMLNHLAPSQHRFVAEDVFSHLRQSIATNTHYDLVVVDPPSFAPSEASLKKALFAYRDLFGLALKITQNEGMVAFGSCSSHVSFDHFLDAIRDALWYTHRQGRILELRGQPSDHPMSPAFPQGRYLKFAIVQLAD